MADLTYETASKRLEEIVKELETGGKSLDESVKLFEEGAKLAQFCNNALKQAEQRIISLSQAGDGNE